MEIAAPKSLIFKDNMVPIRLMVFMIKNRVDKNLEPNGQRPV